MPWSKPKLFYNHALANLVASSTDATGDFDVAYLLDRLEVTFWQASSSADQTISYEAVLSDFLSTDYDALAISVRDIATDPDNTLWAPDYATGKIHNFTKAGVLISSFLNSVFDPLATDVEGIAVAIDDNLLVCSPTTDKIYKISRTGTWISEFPTSSFDAAATSPTGIACDNNGTYWICCSVANKVYNVKDDGTLISSFATSVFDSAATYLMGIACAKNGTLWVYDDTSHKFYNLKKDGTKIDEFPLSAFGDLVSSPHGLDCDDDDNLWISDKSKKTIFNTRPLIKTDFLAIFGHNLNSARGRVSFQYSNDGFVSDINDALTDFIPSDGTTAVEFTSHYARSQKLHIKGASVAPYMAGCYWGEVVELDYISSSFDPHAEKKHANIIKSMTGYLQEIDEQWTERPFTLTFNNSDDALYQKIKALWDAMGLLNFVIQWEPTDHADDVWLMHIDDPKFEAKLVKGGAYRNVPLKLSGRME